MQRLQCTAQVSRMRLPVDGVVQIGRRRRSPARRRIQDEARTGVGGHTGLPAGRDKSLVTGPNDDPAFPVDDVGVGKRWRCAKNCLGRSGDLLQNPATAKKCAECGIGLVGKATSRTPGFHPRVRQWYVAVRVYILG